MTDDKGRRVKKSRSFYTCRNFRTFRSAYSGMTHFYVAAENEKQARQVAESVVCKNRENLIKDTPQKVSL